MAQFGITLDERSLRLTQRALARVIAHFPGEVADDSLAAAAAVAVRAARVKGFGFRDRSGRLRRSVRVRRRRAVDSHGQSRRYADIVAGGRKGSRHAPLVELGTYVARPHPYLQPAVSENLEAMRAAFIQHAKPLLRSLVARSR